MIRVMVVDDYEPFWRLVSETLAKGRDFQVVATAASGEEALRLADGVCPDLVLMDVELGSGMNGFEAARRTLSRHPNTKIVLLSMYDGAEYSRVAAQIGALAFIPKRDFSPETLGKLLGIAKGPTESVSGPGP